MNLLSNVQETHTPKRIQFESLQDLFLSAFVRTHTDNEPVSTAKTMIWCRELMGEICGRQPKFSGNVPQTAENEVSNNLSTKQALQQAFPWELWVITSKGARLQRKTPSDPEELGHDKQSQTGRMCREQIKHKEQTKGVDGLHNAPYHEFIFWAVSTLQ